MIQPVILCGGSGKRLWPVSRPHMPKPFLKLFGERTLFQQAIDRVAHPMFLKPLVVCGKDHEEIAREQAGSCVLAVEPAPRNTATAIALAATLAKADDILLVCPADHLIGDSELFVKAVSEAAQLAKRGLLVCLGITPTRAEPGFGYITLGDALDPGYSISRFWEKPDAGQAAMLIAQSDVVWNAGIFVFRAGDFLREFAQLRPVSAELVSRSVECGEELEGGFYPSAELYDDIIGESVDFAVFENTANAAVVTTEMEWSDVGNWRAFMDARPSDRQGNVADASARMADCKNVLIHSDGPRVSVIGLENVVIVVDGDEILITARDHAQKLNEYLESDLP